MGLITAADVRALAKWSAKIADADLAPHLASAARAMKLRCEAVVEGLYADLCDPYTERPADDNLCAKEVEACLAIALALPSFNSFILADGPVVPKQIEDQDYQFLTPEQVEKQVAVWRKRADDAFDSWQWVEPANDDEASAAEKRWFAI